MIDLKSRKILFFCFVSVLVVSVFLFSQGTDDQVYQGRWVQCVDRLADGSIYGGQPECEQPPMVFVLGWILSSVGNLQLLSAIAFVVLNTVILWLIIKIVDEDDAVIVGSITLIYCFTVLPTILTNLASILSAVFVLASLYMLKDETVKGTVRVSFLLCLGLMSKVTSLSAIVAILAVIVLRWCKKDKEDKNVLYKKIIAFAAPMLLTIFVAKVIYPNILVYMILSHTYDEELGYVNSIKGILSTNPLGDYNLLLFYLLIAAGYIYYQRHADELAIIFIVSYVTSFISKFKPRGESPGIFDTYYLLFPLLFLIIVVGRYLRTHKKDNAVKKYALVFVIASLFFGNFHMGGKTFNQRLVEVRGGYDAMIQEYYQTETEIEWIKNRVRGYYNLLPKNTGPILVNQEIFDVLEGGDHDLNMDLVDNRNNPDKEYRYFPSDYGFGLMHYNITDRSTPFELNEYEMELARDIESGKYEMIFVGPKTWDSAISYAISNVSDENLDRYCPVYLPYFYPEKNVRHRSILLFSNVTHCTQTALAALSYSHEIFDDLCDKDEWAANYLARQVMSENEAFIEGKGVRKLIVNKLCQSKSDVLDRYRKAKDQSVIENNQKKTALILAVVGILAIYKKKK